MPSSDSRILVLQKPIRISHHPTDKQKKMQPGIINKQNQNHLPIKYQSFHLYALTTTPS